MHMCVLGLNVKYSSYCERVKDLKDSVINNKSGGTQEQSYFPAFQETK